MPERKITYDVVVAAIEHLQARGERVSVRSIRAYLGAGSLSTIAKHLQIWRETQPQATGTVISIPPAVQQALMSFVMQEYTTRLAAVQSELADREQLNQELLSENDGLQSRVDELESTATQSRDEMANLRGQFERMSVELAEREADLGKARAVNAESDLKLAIAATRLQQLQSVEAEAKRLRDALDTLSLHLRETEADAAISREKGVLQATQLSELQLRLEQETQLRITLERQLVESAFQARRVRARRGDAARPVRPPLPRAPRPRTA